MRRITSVLAALIILVLGSALACAPDESGTSPTVTVTETAEPDERRTVTRTDTVTPEPETVPPVPPPSPESPTDLPTDVPTDIPTDVPTDGTTDPRFDTCEEAKANGYGPYEQGVDPEYDWYDDADDDGTVCEPEPDFPGSPGGEPSE